MENIPCFADILKDFVHVWTFLLNFLCHFTIYSFVVFPIQYCMYCTVFQHVFSLLFLSVLVLADWCQKLFALVLQTLVKLVRVFCFRTNTNNSDLGERAGGLRKRTTHHHLSLIEKPPCFSSSESLGGTLSSKCIIIGLCKLSFTVDWCKIHLARRLSNMLGTSAGAVATSVDIKERHSKGMHEFYRNLSVTFIELIV